MTNQQHPITPPPPHLLKKFSAQAQAEASKRNGAGYLKTVATLCIEWFVNSQSTSNDRQIRSSEITPPPELVQQWWAEETYDPFGVAISKLATQAAQWGADQELEACCEWLKKSTDYHINIEFLRDARRPKPPSLRKQAYDALDTYIYGEPDPKDKERTYNTIRRALEALDD
jgi:hypothetical protein